MGKVNYIPDFYRSKVTIFVGSAIISVILIIVVFFIYNFLIKGSGEVEEEKSAHKLVEEIDETIKSIEEKKGIIKEDSLSQPEKEKKYSVSDINLDGIIWKGENSLAFVNGEVVAVNDVIGGIRIVDIKKESITIIDNKGKEKNITLYKN